MVSEDYAAVEGCKPFMYERYRRDGMLLLEVGLVKGVCRRSITIKDAGERVTGWGNRWCGNDYQDPSALCFEGLLGQKKSCCRLS